MQEEMGREKTFNMRMSAEEWINFEAVAKNYSLPVASMIRMLVKREADTLAVSPSETACFDAAVKIWHRHCEAHEIAFEQPSASMSDVVRPDLFLLRTGRGRVLATFRISRDGRLKIVHDVDNVTVR